MVYAALRPQVAVEGCCHGELDSIYRAIAACETKHGTSVDLLIICGDFQALRSPDDYESISVPPKFRQMGYDESRRLHPQRSLWAGRFISILQVRLWLLYSLCTLVAITKRQTITNLCTTPQYTTSYRIQTQPQSYRYIDNK